jgi:hypothetical protein
MTTRGRQYPDGPLEPAPGERFLPLPREGRAAVFADGTDPNGVPWCPVDEDPGGRSDPLIPFGLPEGYLEAAERYWAGRELDAGYIRRALRLPEPEGETDS